MIVLRRCSIKCPENEKELFMRLYWDTAHANLADEEILEWTRPREIADRMWIGNVDRNTKEFQLQRVKNGWGRSKSWFIIEGKFKTGIVSRTIDFDIGLTWLKVVEGLLTIGMMLSAAITFNNSTLWLILPFVVAAIGGFVFKDFTDSKELISAYLKNPEKVSRLVIK